ncbi:uncharacterized protein B0H64DRAFT_202116 [Chaetomium fimeti]|uniref:Uncharacterized protein n=1 Tax=Chaetomium fimeti TaxID=1854472 RepID=A0AAE0HA95_9PEZI|nr:hypothetical protein B0H64DRAFT_202116 [Chaetomium fimeti]
MSGAVVQPTILSELGVKLPTLDNSRALSGRNTRPADDRDWPEVGDWQLWADFNYENLRSIFRPIVEEPWPNAPSDHRLPNIDPMERELFDEKSLESHLTKHTMPLVNAALVRANTRLHRSQDDRGHLWASGRGGGILGKPDWSLCSPNRKQPSGKYVNLVPGDTKLSTKWKPGMKDTNPGEWALPIRQVMSYSRDLKVRYGFVITDQYLIVLRFSRFDIEDGIAQGMSRRGVTVHQTEGQHSSGASNAQSRPPSAASGSTASHATSGRDSSPYSDGEPTNEWRAPQYQAIPWSSHNSTTGKSSDTKSHVLTVRLALFYLSLLALSGSDISIGGDYPPLDSWTRTKTGYVHNATGEKVTHVPEDATVIERGPSPPPSSHASSRSSSNAPPSSHGSSRSSSNAPSQKDSSRSSSRDPGATQSQSGSRGVSGTRLHPGSQSASRSASTTRRDAAGPPGGGRATRSSVRFAPTHADEHGGSASTPGTPRGRSPAVPGSNQQGGSAPTRAPNQQGGPGPASINTVIRSRPPSGNTRSQSNRRAAEHDAGAGNGGGNGGNGGGNGGNGGGNGGNGGGNGGRGRKPGPK